MAKEKEIKLSEVIEKTAEAGFVMAMTPQERQALMNAGFDYTKHTRRLPTLSDACITYMMENQKDKEPQLD